ncbi:hypothetical protein ACFFQW_43250 [Umezawaea endophytica]|uniref:Uncharacterized protein n=1 Tax=Umezawaea endophytica TaxID=1654476 RepID=A0A9X2VZC3_9PSEU|nr:hypothetical protein [Umezawaea endophytica]MCS7484749.1 hypothetical protein [Umezawaea endophytica]
MRALGVVALATGLAALWTGNELLLAMFIGLIVATWALDTTIHARVLPAAHHRGVTAGHT